jgi:hypothetical protein
MIVPDRPIESDPRFQAMWGDADLCPKCGTELRDLHDDGHAFLVCPVCDLGEPKNNDVSFKLKFYGMTEHQGFDDGIIDESRAEMSETQKWWEDNLHWTIAEFKDGNYIPADIKDGNEAGQWFIYSRGYQIACIVEVPNG